MRHLNEKACRKLKSSGIVQEVILNINLKLKEGALMLKPMSPYEFPGFAF